jgi:RHS repeat-associated protein
VPTIGFTGHVNDANTGLVYMQQRYYDPIAGRFLSTDPVLTDANTGASFNRYVYANNSPYKYIDPDGRQQTLAFCLGGPAGCAVGVVLTGVTVYYAGKAITGTAAAVANSNSSNGSNSGNNSNSSKSTKGSSTSGAAPPPGDNNNDDKDKSGDKELSKQDKKSIRSLEKRVEEHKAKLEAFKQNPTVRPGMEGQSEETIKAQQAERIKHLETECK